MAFEGCFRGCLMGFDTYRELRVYLISLNIHYYERSAIHYQLCHYLLQCSTAGMKVQVAPPPADDEIHDDRLIILREISVGVLVGYT